MIDFDVVFSLALTSELPMGEVEESFMHYTHAIDAPAIVGFSVQKQ